MKNLKRVLSLGLASVMLLGMMVVGASAKDFTDAEDIQHTDAVQTLVALNIIKGKEDGSYFDPKGSVTRAEMAKMIAVAMNGGNEDAPGVKMTPSFTDISTSWAQPFIEYCFDMGIISGRGDGTFDPEGKVTGMEVTKMVLTALGYNAEAYQLTGASWYARTNEVAQTAYPKSLFSELNGVSMNAPATRDVAAQLIWNGLQSCVSVFRPTADKQSTGLEWTYEIDKTTTLLNQRYNAITREGVYTGNSKSVSGLEKGHIQVTLKDPNYDTSGNLTGYSNVAYDFPSDMDISNIGEEVRVVFRNGTRSLRNGPDKNDTIFGVFNTGRTTVYNIIEDDIQEVTSSKVKFGGTKYDYELGGTITFNYGAKAPVDLTQANLEALKKDTADSIKFVCSTTTGKIRDAFVIERSIDVISGVTDEKFSTRTVSGLKLEDHEVYEDMAKDDVVITTQLYDSKKSDATWIIEKAELISGTIDKYYGSNKVEVDGTTVEIDPVKKNPVLDGSGHANYDKTDNLEDTFLTKNFEFVMYGKRYVAAKALDDLEKNFALVLAATKGDNITGQTVRLLMPDGTKQTFTLDEESVVANTDLTAYFKNLPGQTAVASGRTDMDESTVDNSSKAMLVSYNIQNDGKIILKPQSKATGSQGAYNKDTKTLYKTASGASGVPTGSYTDLIGTLSTDAVGFVYTGATDGWKVYKANNLKSMLGTGVDLQYKKNATDGRVPAFALYLDAAVGVDAADYKYMYITKDPVAYETSNGDKYTDVTGVTVDGEDVEITVENVKVTEQVIGKGRFIQYKEASDGSVDFTDVKAVTNLARVEEYDEARRILIIEDPTDATKTKTYAVAKDVVIVNVNTADTKAGGGVGINTKDPVERTYQNVVFITDTVDGVDDTIVGIFVDDNRQVKMKTVNMTGKSLAEIKNALKGGEVIVNAADISSALEIPKGGTLTIADTATKGAFDNLTGGAKGVKVKVNVDSTISGQLDAYKTTGNAANTSVTPNVAAAAGTKVANNAVLKAGATFQWAEVYPAADSVVAEKWLVTDATKIAS